MLVCGHEGERGDFLTSVVVLPTEINVLSPFFGFILYLVLCTVRLGAGELDEYINPRD